MTFSDLALRAEARPPLSCRLGFHRGFQAERLITTGHFVCAKCGRVFLTSLWGDFPLTRGDSALWLRARDRDAGYDGDPASGLHPVGAAARPEGIAR